MVETGQNQFLEATEPTRTGPSPFGCSPATFGATKNRSQSTVAPFEGAKTGQDRTLEQ